MTPAELALAVCAAVRSVAEDGGTRVPVPRPADVPVTVARPGTAAGRTSADYGTGVALRLAAPAGLPARDLAALIAARLAARDAVERADVTGPGFLNVTLTPAARARVVRAARTAGHRWGTGDDLAGAPLDPPAPAGDEPRSAAVVRLLRARGADLPPPPPPGPGHPALGADATAWALTRPAPGDRPDLDPRTHLPQRAANPLFRVRYAHARVRALHRNAADLGFGPAEGDRPDPAGAAVFAVVADWPRVVGDAARHRAPDRIARALESAAGAVLDLQDTAVLPRGDEKPSAAHRARLALADAAGSVLAGGLSLLGVTAPDHL